MSFLPLDNVTLGNGAQLDMFNVLRTSQKHIAFEYAGKYDQGLLLWEHSLSGTGSVTFNTNNGSNTLSTGGTASGATAIRQSHQYIIYNPGQGRQAIIGMNIGAAATNVRRRVGMFDTNNGAFIEQTSTGIRMVLRSDTTGSIVDSLYEQASWNIDKLDGTGQSGITLDITKSQALIIEWVGYNVASVRFGFLLEGLIRYVHQVNNLNAIAVFALGSSFLPVRYEITNTGTAAGSSNLGASSCVVYDENGPTEDEFAYGFTANMGTTSIGVTTRRPVLSIRPKTTFNSITNRGHIHATLVTIMAKTNDCLVELVRNGTLTGAAFGSVDANSIAEFDVTATAISGGMVLSSAYAAAGTGSTGNSVSGGLNSRLGLFNNFAGSTTDTLSVVVTSISGTSNVLSSLNWDEQR